jgi:hypothetical protein
MRTINSNYTHQNTRYSSIQPANQDKAANFIPQPVEKIPFQRELRVAGALCSAAYN